MSFAHKTRVGVLRGGPSDEYNISLNTGKTILANLPEEYEPLDIFISRDGAWHIGGVSKDAHKILHMIDVVINAMHGTYGEDGTVQKLFENFGVPYTGSDSMSSALGMNKIMSKNIFKSRGLKTPQYIILKKNEGEGVTASMIREINENLIFPIMIKPANSGSSIGVSFVNNVSGIADSLTKAYKYSPILIAEEYINGKEATCGVIESFRGTPIYTLLPVEVASHPNNHFHDYDSKYVELKSKYKVPGNFSEEESQQIKDAAILMHQALGLRHYSRSDFVLHPKRGLFCLETNSLPELSHRSSFVKSLEAVGGNIKEFLSHLLSKTLKR